MQRDAIIHAAALAAGGAVVAAEHIISQAANAPLDCGSRREKRALRLSRHDMLANLFPATGTERCCLAVHRVLDQSRAADCARSADAKGMGAVIAGRDLRTGAAGQEAAEENDLPHEARSITLQAGPEQD